MLICFAFFQDSTDSVEHESTGAASGIMSDVSWEQIEEKDAQMTLWVPDHAVTHCAGCNQEFWMVRRKHHCRLVPWSLEKRFFCSLDRYCSFNVFNYGIEFSS